MIENCSTAVDLIHNTLNCFTCAILTTDVELEVDVGARAKPIPETIVFGYFATNCS